MALIDTGNLLEPTNVRKPGDFWRNHQGAPYVTHPTETKKDGTPKRVVYGRPSSFGSALDNAYNLVKWKERQLLLGAATLDALDDSWIYELRDIDYENDRAAVDGLVARCHQAAGSSLAADRGTHIHLLLEGFDRDGVDDSLIDDGETLGIPAALQFNIVDQWRAFRAELGVTALAIEATVVHDGWRLAGTLDRLDVPDKDILTGLGVLPAGCAFIGDIKTGSLTLGRDGQPNYWVKYPVQLAAYAYGFPYDTETDERRKWDAVPHELIALIYHYDLAQALEGIPTDWQAIPVNLTAGREGGDLCRLAADFGKRRDLFLMPAPSHPEAAPGVEPTTGPAPATPGPVVDEPTWHQLDDGSIVVDDSFHIVVSDGRRGSVTIRSSRTWIRDSIKELVAAGHEQIIRNAWPLGVPPLTETTHTTDQLKQLFFMVRAVKADVGFPFDPEPQIAGAGGAESTNPSPAPALLPDDGAFLDPNEIELLKRRMLALPDTRHIQLADISKEANAAGRPISVTQKPCVRRWEIARALVLWAEGDSDIYALGNRAIEVATAEQCRTAMDTENFGALISQFTIEQAIKLADYFYPITAKEQQPL